MAKAVVVPMKNHAEKARRRRRSAAAPSPVGRSVAPSAHAALPAAAPRPVSRMTRKKLIEESRRWLGIINAHKLNDYKRRKIVTDTRRQLPLLLQPGLPRVPQVGDRGRASSRRSSGADEGSYFQDITGRALHRLPRRLRHLLRGHQPPEDRARGQVAARAHAAQLAGAARPAARRAGGAAGRARAGRPAGLLLHQQRHRRGRGRDEARAPLHGQARLHLLHARLPRQVATARCR